MTTLIGTTADNTLFGTAGADIIIGLAGNDTISGGAGNDIILGDGGSAPVQNSTTSGWARIVIDGQAGAYDGALLVQITSASGQTRIQTLTSSYDSSIGIVYHVALSGGDTIRVGITSPEGTFWSNTQNAVVNQSNQEWARISFEDTASLGDRDFDDVRVDVTLGGNITLLLPDGGAINPAPISILPDEGNDSINAGAGDDTVLGGGGDDTMHGAQGNDVLFGGDGNDSANGGLGNDFIMGEAGADTLSGSGGSDTIEGGDGDDLIIGGSSSDAPQSGLTL
jgi:Ca2+-binding RTX toxin-like protein